ncbi:hypothetical protein NRS6120_07270 [Bacillus subtilis]|nr:hypothetical protein NRS6120_04245 [Bacillus subtilis]CAI6253629.1 hypothetical protein NRS6120_07270 [Bacillus subtilis]
MDVNYLYSNVFVFLLMSKNKKAENSVKIYATLVIKHESFLLHLRTTPANEGIGRPCRSRLVLFIKAKLDGFHISIKQIVLYVAFITAPKIAEQRVSLCRAYLQLQSHFSFRPIDNIVWVYTCQAVFLISELGAETRLIQTLTNELGFFAISPPTNVCGIFGS